MKSSVVVAKEAEEPSATEVKATLESGKHKLSEGTSGS